MLNLTLWPARVVHPHIDVNPEKTNGGLRICTVDIEVLTAPNGYHGQNVLFQKVNTQRNWFEFDDGQLGIQILSEQSVHGIHLWDDSNSIKTSQRFITNCWYLPCCFWENTFVKFISSVQVLKLSRIKLQFHRTVSVALKHVHGLYSTNIGKETWPG